MAINSKKGASQAIPVFYQGPPESISSLTLAANTDISKSTLQRWHLEEQEGHNKGHRTRRLFLQQERRTQKKIKGRHVLFSQFSLHKGQIKSFLFEIGCFLLKSFKKKIVDHLSPAASESHVHKTESGRGLNQMWSTLKNIQNDENDD